jgi:hypothetical protein
VEEPIDLSKLIHGAKQNGHSEQPQQMAIPMELPPQPVPTIASLSQVPGPDGALWVIEKITTPVGPQLFWFNAPVAVQLGKRMAYLGRVSKSGIVLPFDAPFPDDDDD